MRKKLHIYIRVCVCECKFFTCNYANQLCGRNLSGFVVVVAAFNVIKLVHAHTRQLPLQCHACYFTQAKESFHRIYILKVWLRGSRRLLLVCHPASAFIVSVVQIELFPVASHCSLKFLQPLYSSSFSSFSHFRSSQLVS